MAAVERTTAFGRSVVPEVRTTTAGSRGSRGSAAIGGRVCVPRVSAATSQLVVTDYGREVGRFANAAVSHEIGPRRLETRRRDDQPRRDDLDGNSQLAPGQPGRERCRDDPKAGETMEGCHGRGGGRGQQCDPVARPNARVPEGVHGGVRAPIELLPCPADGSVDDGASLSARTAVRLSDHDVITGFGFPFRSKSDVDLFVEFARRII